MFKNFLVEKYGFYKKYLMILPLKSNKFNKSYLEKKVYKTKKSCICTKYPPLSAKCSSLKMENYHPGLLVV